MEQIKTEKTPQKARDITALATRYAKLTEGKDEADNIKETIKEYAKGHREVFKGGTVWDLGVKKLKLKRSEYLVAEYVEDLLTLDILEEILRTPSFACVKVSIVPKEVKSATDDPDIHRVLAKIGYKTHIRENLSLTTKQ